MPEETVVEGTSAQAQAASVKLDKPAPKDRFNGGHLLFFEGLYFYSGWKETHSYYDYWAGAMRSVEYRYTQRITALLGSYSYIFSSGLSLGGSLGVMDLASSRKLVSGQSSYYYGGDYSGSSSINLIGPRVGYYLLKSGGKAVPFVALEYDMISGSFNLDEKMIRVGGGVLIPVKKGAGISIGMDYVKFSEQKNATNLMALAGVNLSL